jgi:hypothetical protein
VHLNLAYRWFCRLGLEDAVPEHSTFSKSRHGRFRESDAFRHVFETVLNRCINEGLVRGEGFAIDASVVKADAACASAIPGATIDYRALGPAQASRALREYLEGLDADGRPETMRKNISVTDPAAECDMAYGTAELLAWMVNEKAIEPHVSLWDKTQRTDDTLSSSDFQWDEQGNEYRCPQGHALRSEWRPFKNLRTHITKDENIIYRSRQSDCAGCPMKARCCPHTPIRKIRRSIHEDARNVARAVAKTRLYKQSRKDRNKVEMLFAHLKRILNLRRLRLRGSSGAHDEFLLAAIAQNLRRMAKRLCPPVPLPAFEGT